ncbi:MAG: hypothetical protein AAF399_23075, partial [Bacteroidota bacterium]
QHAMKRQDYQQLLEQEIAKKGCVEFRYEKNAETLFELLEKYGELDQAIKWAKALEAGFGVGQDFANQNPCTTVYQLVEKSSG